MPTKRLNISLVDQNIIEELHCLRESLESITKKRLSLADVVKVLINVRPSDNYLSERI